MAKTYVMSKHALQVAHDKFKDDPRIVEAKENGWLIYLRDNGFLTLNPNVEIPKIKMNKIEKNYCLYN